MRTLNNPISFLCPETNSPTRLDVEQVCGMIALREGTPLSPGINGSLYMTPEDAKKLANRILEQVAAMEGGK